MHFVQRPLMVPVTFAVGLVFGIHLSAAIAAQGTTPDVLQGILNEVHGLRMVMETTASVIPRMHVVVSRLNIEEQRFGRATAQFDDVQRQLMSVESDLKKIAVGLADVEKCLQTEVDEHTRKSCELERMSLLKDQMAKSLVADRLRVRENSLAQTVSAEQGQWTDLNSRLDELERVLAATK
jgi:chaperonin cofactor prefoldin